MANKTQPKTHLSRRIVNAKLFIDNYYLDDIDVNSMAYKACLSKYHFLRLFKQIYRVTPHQYLTALRIEKAKELLRNNTSITQTCYSLGFSSRSSFNKLFMRHVKAKPSVYAAQIKISDTDIMNHPLKYVPFCFITYMGWDK